MLAKMRDVAHVSYPKGRNILEQLSLKEWRPKHE